MDMKQIKELMATMEKTGLKKVRIKEEKGFEIEIERNGEFSHATLPSKHYETPHFAPSHSLPPSTLQKEGETKKDTEVTGTFVDSPMVGTFYSAASPEDPSYVKIGDEVDVDTIVCIIEAMKVMNEVKAGKKGKISEILVNNADPVEFGTHLFRII